MPDVMRLCFAVGISILCLLAPAGEPEKPEKQPHCCSGLPRASSSRCDFKELTNIAYTVGYSEFYKNPLWSAYYLFWTDNQQHAPRPGKFKADNRTEAKVKHDDYTQSRPTTYDRGHMTPNHAIVSRYGPDAQAQTFLMSNVCPQKAKLNQQTWQGLEHVVANKFSRDFEHLWVIVGPIFDDNPKRLNGVAAIPKAFYMIVAGKTGDDDMQVLAVVMNQDVSGSKPLRDFVTTVNKVEEQTGLDFFHELEDVAEEKLESSDADEI